MDILYPDQYHHFNLNASIRDGKVSITVPEWNLLSYAVREAKYNERFGPNAWKESNPRLYNEADFTHSMLASRQVKLNFSHSAWNNLLESTFTELRKLAALKGAEYSGDEDRLANFRRNAAALGLLKEQVWAVYSSKHWDAIMQYVKDLGSNTKRERLETPMSRVDDMLVYLLLFKAMLIENSPKGEGEASAQA